jgi:endo-1,4-beta-D-glucanase Y
MMETMPQGRSQGRCGSILLACILLFCLLKPELLAETNRPFPQAGNTPCFGIKPNDRSQADMNTAVFNFYTNWIADYMMESTTVPGDYKINYDGGGATVSEAMGYGMLLAVLMAGADPNAKQYFDGLNRFRKRYPSSINANLMEWKVYPDEISRNDDCATDGDIDLAMALLTAYIQWGQTNYFREATNIIHNIATSLIRADYSIRLGDWNSAEGQTRTSDFIGTHFRSFYLATGDGLWTNVENKCYAILEQLQADYAAGTGLLPDFAVTSGGSWAPAPAFFLEGPNDGRYYYNACRDPWRISCSALYYNEDRARSIMASLMPWVTNTHAGPSGFKGGYRLDGSDIAGNNYDTAAFISPIGVAAMIVTNQQWLNDTFTYSIARNELYYEDSLNLFSLIAMSGNLWLWDTLDADMDNIPDAWERKYVGNLMEISDGGSDWDSDGDTDYLEYVARTDPTDSDNVFRIIAVQRAGETNQVSWMTAFDNTDLSPFRVDCSTNLLAEDGGWVFATGTIELAGAGTNLFRDAMSHSSWKMVYYRIVATTNTE